MSKQNNIYQEQINMLLNKGILIEDKIEAIKVLSSLNYYSFIGYIPNFTNENVNYENKISFNNIYKTYLFDRRLRNIVLYIIEIIENTIKTKISYAFSIESGDFGYLDNSNYKDAKEYKMLMSNLKRLLQKDKKLELVDYYVKKYGNKLPIYIGINVFTMGMINSLYKNINTNIQKKIAKEYNTGVNQLTSWIENIVYIRNLVAHYMRLYNFKLQKTPANCKLNHQSNIITYRIFDIFHIMKFLVLDKDEWNNHILAVLDALIEEYKEYIELDLIGFCEDWKEILIKH